MDEDMRYYDADNIHDLAGDIIAATDTLKYIYSNYALKANADDLQYYNEETKEAFEHLRDNCADFIRAYDYYSANAENADK